jgi:hypothetical protein
MPAFLQVETKLCVHPNMLKKRCKIGIINKNKWNMRDKKIVQTNLAIRQFRKFSWQFAKK